jgi:site-specific recombinase XerD
MITDLIKPNILPDAITLELGRDPSLKSNHSRRAYKADLAAFEAWRSGRQITRLLVESYAAELQAAGLAPNTINRRLAAIRWWARRLVDLAAEDTSLTPDQVDAITHQAERAAGVADVRGSRPIRGRHLTSGELGALLQGCEVDPTPAGVRDSALIALAWCTGARRSELAGLALADFTPTGEGEGDLTVRGKGDKVRALYVYNGAAHALADWLELRGGDPGPLFLAINKGGKLAMQGLSGESMRVLLDKRVTMAGVNPLTWHDFRRTFAGNLLDSGVDLVTVQKLMGHSDPTTTSNYDRRGDEVKRKAIKTLFVPYHGRKPAK